MDYRTLNPTTEELVQTFATHSDADVDAALRQAVTSHREWRKTALARRLDWLTKTATLLDFFAVFF